MTIKHWLVAVASACAAASACALAADQAAKDPREAAIRRSADDYAKAFEKHDAKALAAMWTEQGECHDEGGEVIRGRAAIEQAFTQLFTEHPDLKTDVLIESIRFPAMDLAVEEGLLRMSSKGKELPSTSQYSAFHVREGGQWKIAISREWGAGQDRLEDLDWFIGTWKGSAGDQEITISFARDDKTPMLVGKFNKKSSGAASGGTMKIGFDARRGVLRSSHVDDDGGHGQALWTRDGNRWLLYSTGVTADGTETAAINVISRVSEDAFTWRSVERVMGQQEAPDTVPIKLTRVVAAK